MTLRSADAAEPLDIASLPPLSRGSHSKRSGEMCFMEAVACVAREPWSDAPECACPVIGAFLRAAGAVLVRQGAAA